MKVLFHADFFSSDLSGFQSQKYFLGERFEIMKIKKIKWNKKHFVGKKTHKERGFFSCVKTKMREIKNKHEKSILR